jgi:hypothetical protein
MKRILILFAALASCGPEPQPAQPDTLPTPSGPPVPQAAPQPPGPATAAAPMWESVVQGDAMVLRLVEGADVRMEMACLASPARLAVEVPGFTVIASEDRFSLGLGAEPVNLVADISRTEGIAAEGPIPGNLKQLLDRAKQVSALYGAQQVGPVPPPPPGLVGAFAEACKKLDG